MNMDTLRKRLQRTTLEKHGVQGVQLWHAAMKVLFASRVILPQVDQENVVSRGSKFIAEMQIVNAVPGEPVLAVIGESTEPSLPVVTEFDRRPAIPIASQRSLFHGRVSGAKGIAELSGPIKKPFDRDSRNPKDFPTWLWKRIIVEYAEGDGILNSQQAENIIEYAKDRSNLREEQQNQAKGESHQLWHVLEQVDCLTYTLD